MSAAPSLLIAPAPLQTQRPIFLPHLKPGMHVLDIGCGPGTITLDLAALVAPGKVVGIENVEAPLLAARAEAVARSDVSTTFQLGDALKLPFENESFDVVHAHQVLQHLPDPVTALREMVRVCKSGGWIAARDADYACHVLVSRASGTRGMATNLSCRSPR